MTMAFRRIATTVSVGTGLARTRCSHPRRSRRLPRTCRKPESVSRTATRNCALPEAEAGRSSSRPAACDSVMSCGVYSRDRSARASISPGTQDFHTLSAANSERCGERGDKKSEEHEATGGLPPAGRSGDRADYRRRPDRDRDPDRKRPGLAQHELAQRPHQATSGAGRAASPPEPPEPPAPPVAVAAAPVAAAPDGAPAP